jgi:hypothetical protein
MRQPLEVPKDEKDSRQCFNMSTQLLEAVSVVHGLGWTSGMTLNQTIEEKLFFFISAFTKHGEIYICP